MISRKQFNLLFSIVVVLLSAVAIIFLDDSSGLTGNYKKPVPTEIPIETGNTLGVFITQAPIITPATQEDLIITEKEEPAIDGFKVVKVIDGDTIDVDIEGKIERLRLIGIDTPETVDPRKSVQCFGIEASNKAKETLLGQFVSLEADESQGERDKYKRLLRYVFLPDGTNFNLYMIAEGYAYEYTYDEPYKYQPDFKEAQRLARENNKGLWSPSTCSGNK